jgi:hypothetical protein
MHLRRALAIVIRPFWAIVVAFVLDASVVKAGSLPAPPIALNSQSKLVAEFTIPQPQSGESLQTVDALMFYAGQLSVPQAGTILQARLYDGDALLGVHQRAFSRGSFAGELFRFTTPDSEAAGDAALIDFAPIRMRTLQGRIEFNLLSGKADLLTIPETHVFLVRAFGLQGGTTFSPAIQTEVSFVPELSTLALASICALPMVYQRRQSRRLTSHFS